MFSAFLRHVKQQRAYRQALCCAVAYDSDLHEFHKMEWVHAKLGLTQKESMTDQRQAAHCKATSILLEW